MLLTIKKILFISVLLVFMTACNKEDLKDNENSINQKNDLIINEISSGIYTNSSRWFELYNSSSSSINLGLYTLKSLYYDGEDSGTFEFTFPNKVIPPGEYLVVHSNYGPAFDIELSNIENKQVIYLKDMNSTKYPIWNSINSGFLELLKDGQTVDFISFGKNFKSTSEGSWSGQPVPTFSAEEWISIAREGNSKDTNSFLDWKEKDFQTYAGANDVTCNKDDDNDGIPDCSEVEGSTYAGMDLYSFGARINQKDIFIEVDYMDSTNGGVLAFDKGMLPQKESLEKVRNVFSKNGYKVHFDVGDLFAKNGKDIDVSLMDLGGGNEVEYTPIVNLGCTHEGVDIRNYKVNNMKVERRQIFYYMFFGSSQNSTDSLSGCSEHPGNDSLISLKGWNLSKNSEINSNKLINFQSGIIMHEFGHNLGLGHGGDENKNYKPNYISVMNYLYLLQGLPTIGENEGDRYYTLYQNKECKNIVTTVTNPYWGDPKNFKIDYSHGEGKDLDEVEGLLEVNGLGQSNSKEVDFNCNGLNNDVLTNENINSQADSVMNKLTDHDDWGAINLIFSKRYKAKSRILSKLSSSMTLTKDFVWDDIQPVSLEQKIPHFSNE